MKEMWIPVEGFEDFYEVSNTGKVRSLTRTVYRKCGKHYEARGRILAGSMFGNYRGVQMQGGDKKKRAYIHRLVAYHFIGKPPRNDYTVNHKDGDRLNNHVDNLEWLSQAENNRHAMESGLMNNLVGERSHFCKFSDQTVAEIRDLYDHGIYRQSELAEMYGVSKMQVNRIVRRLLRVGGKQRENKRVNHRNRQSALEISSGVSSS